MPDTQAAHLLSRFSADSVRGDAASSALEHTFRPLQRQNPFKSPHEYSHRKPLFCGWNISVFSEPNVLSGLSRTTAA